MLGIKIPVSLSALIAYCLFASLGAVDVKQPRHVHIAYGDEAHKMIVTWSSINLTDSFVIYGLTRTMLNMTQKGYSDMFVDGGSEKLSQFIHRVELVDLKPNTTYYYYVGSTEGWSTTFYFKSMPAGQDWGPSIVAYGDLGSANAQSLPRLLVDAAQGMYDVVVHVGDFAYDLSKDQGRVGDTFMEQIEPLAATLPYMTCNGNHENYYNFSNYRARFNMPNDNKRMYYSFNVGPIHFVSMSTEFMYFPNYGMQQIFDHYEFVKNDLIEANKPENRAKRPWIVTFGHRPMYCSNSDNDDCASYESLVRVGVPLYGIKGFEDLFHEQGVDVALWAHEHTYERMWPVYKLQVRNGSSENPYKNPGAVTHIVTGSAGCIERHEYFTKNPPPWSAFHSSEYGYTRMKFANKTHLYVEQVSDDREGLVIDRFTLIKDHHGPYKN